MKRIFMTATLGALAIGGISTAAEEAKRATIAALYQNKVTLNGQLVLVQGVVVKVNNAIMGRNFLHLQDGTGKHGTNDLTLTSQQTASVGDRILASGRVVVDKDFGAGYFYPLLLEEATISPAKQ